MSLKWIIVLIIYFYDSDRVDIQSTPYQFADGIECAKFTHQDEFRDLLLNTFKDKGISYVRPICKPTRLQETDVLVKSDKVEYGSVGLCRVAPCIW